MKKFIFRLVVLSTLMIQLFSSSVFGVQMSSDEQKLRKAFTDAKGKYQAVVSNLNAAYNKTPGFLISGEIEEKGSNYVIWGTATPQLGDPSPNCLGWVESDSNIKLLNPSAANIQYSTNYEGGPYFYKREETGQNLFGQDVPIYVYGAAPKEITTLQNSVKSSLNSLKETTKKLVDYVNKSYQTKITANPKSSELYLEYGDSIYNLAYTIEDTKLINQAIGYYKKALELNPSNISACFALGDVCLSKVINNEKNAIQYYKLAAKINPEALVKHVNTKSSLYCAGVALSEIQKFDSAVVVFNKAIKLGDSRIGTLKKLIVAYQGVTSDFWKNNNTAKAIETCNTALNILKNANATDEDAMIHLDVPYEICKMQISVLYLQGQIYYDSDKERTVSSFTQAKTLHVEKMEDNKYVEWLEKNKDLYTTLSGIDVQLSRIYCSKGDNKAAYQCLLEAWNNKMESGDNGMIALQTSDTAQMHYLCGLVYIKTITMKHEVNAAAEFEKAMQMEPNSARYVNAIGLMTYYSYDYDDKKRTLDTLYKARDYFKKVIELDSNYTLAYGNLLNSLSAIQEVTKEYLNQDIMNLKVKCREKATVEGELIRGFEEYK